MKIAKSLLVFCLFSFALSACWFKHFKNHDGMAAGIVGVGTSWFPRSDLPAPKYDPNDFQPASRATGISNNNVNPIELNLSAELRLRLLPWIYAGLVSDYLTFGSEGFGSCRFYNCRVVRYSALHWWDEVALEDVVIERSPSIGLIVGLMPYDLRFDRHDRPFKTMIQYGITVSRYETTMHNYAGKDCVGCINTSYVKDSTVISSGIAWRHTVTVGLEILRMAFWVETNGSKQVSAGLNFILLGILFVEKGDSDLQ